MRRPDEDRRLHHRARSHPSYFGAPQTQSLATKSSSRAFRAQRSLSAPAQTDAPRMSRPPDTAKFRVRLAVGAPPFPSIPDRPNAKPPRPRREFSRIRRAGRIESPILILYPLSLNESSRKTRSRRTHPRGPHCDLASGEPCARRRWLAPVRGAFSAPGQPSPNPPTPRDPPSRCRACTAPLRSTIFSK